MDKSTTQKFTRKHFDIILAVITWISIIIQMSLSNNLVNTFSYFTILSNLVIALSLTTTVIKPGSKPGRFFSGTSVQSAMTLYILIVALIYNFIIRITWIQPLPNFLSNNILHIITPALYLLRWIIYLPKGELTWTSSIKWLIFPFLYLFYSLIRGAIITWYPYSFIDLRKISTSDAAINIVLVLILFLIIGLGLIFTDRVLDKRQLRKSEK